MDSCHTPDIFAALQLTAVLEEDLQQLPVCSLRRAVSILICITCRSKFFLLLTAPGQVTHLRTESIADSNSSLLVTWQPPTLPNGIITGYELNVSTPRFKVSDYVGIPASSVVNLTVKDLCKYTCLGAVSNGNNLSFFPVPFVPYYFTVSALTKKGRGFSSTVLDFTLEGGKMKEVLVGCKVLHFTTFPGFFRTRTWSFPDQCHQTECFTDCGPLESTQSREGSWLYHKVHCHSTASCLSCEARGSIECVSEPQ